MVIDPTQDGIDHINIYSQGRTILGCMLSNFAYMPVKLPEGTFASIEGYWFWLGTHEEVLMCLYGTVAKKVGGQLPRTVEVPDFEDKIRHALRAKTAQHSVLSDRLKASELPFAHYYVYGGRAVPAGYEWLVQEWEAIRKDLK